MKKLFLWAAVLLLAACTDKEAQLQKRAAELCRYIPGQELSEESKGFLTADFYAVLDTLFHHLPGHEAMDHEWLHYFVAADGSAITDCEVTEATQTDPTHAVATIIVRQQREDGSPDESADAGQHTLYMELVQGQWLMSDFDDHKKDCIRHIAISRNEEALRTAMRAYLVSEIGVHYLQGELCVPTLMTVAEEKQGDETHVWCDCWVEWYNLAGDTLKAVSGGNHSGRMILQQKERAPVVTAFEQTADGAAFLPSARRIFGEHFDVYQNMHSNQDVRDAARMEQLQEYIQRRKLNARYLQDFGSEAVALSQSH